MYKKVINYFDIYKNKIFIYEILFAFSIVYYFGYAFFGLDFSDLFFHLNNAKYEGSGINFLIVLSTLIIKFILGYVTENILLVRIIAGIIKILPLFIFFYYFRMSKRSFLIWTFIVLIIITPNNAFILGYDAFSVFIFTLILLVLFKNSTNFNYPAILLLSVLSSCAVLIRFPNILVISIVFLRIFFSGNAKSFYLNRNFRKAFFYLVNTLFFTFLVYYLIYGNLDTLLASNSVEVKSVGHHGITTLIECYIRDLYKILFYLIEIFIFLWLFAKVKISQENKIGCFFILFIFHLLFLYKYISFSSYSFTFSLYITSIMIFFVGHNLFFNKVQDLKIKVFFLLFFLFLFIEPFGSNTGLLKAVPLFILFPFIYKFSTLPTKKTYLIILVTILPFAILEKPNSIYQDAKLSKLHYSTEVNNIQGIYTNEKRAQFVNSIDAEYKNLTRMNYTVFFYGDKSHIFRYLYPSHVFNIKDFYQPIDHLIYLNQILKETNKFKKSAIFIVNSYPSKNFNYNESVLEKELIKNNFKLVLKNEIVYYKN